MIAFSPNEWHASTPRAAPNPTRLTEGIKNRTLSLRKSYAARVIDLFKSAAKEWLRDRCPQLGAALAYYTVFSLAPLVIVLLGVFGLIYGSNEGTREKILDQLRYHLDPSGVKVIQDIATSAAHPTASVLATVIGVFVALFGASCIFGQLQDALNTIWSIKPKPSRGFSSFVRARFLSFAMVGCICFLLLLSFVVAGSLHALHDYLQTNIPGGLYLASGAAGSAYGAASSLVTLLLWIFYSAQIFLFGAEFTKVYAETYGSWVRPHHYAVKVERKEIELPSQEKSESRYR
jgi:membrane protein